MRKKNVDIHIGEAPGLLFIPGPPPKVSETTPPERILVIAIPALYVHVRDLVIADQTARCLQENAKDVDQLMRELLKYKPSPDTSVEEIGNGTTFTDPTIFNIKDWLKGNGGVVLDNES